MWCSFGKSRSEVTSIWIIWHFLLQSLIERNTCSSEDSKELQWTTFLISGQKTWIQNLLIQGRESVNRWYRKPQLLETSPSSSAIYYRHSVSAVPADWSGSLCSNSSLVQFHSFLDWKSNLVEDIAGELLISTWPAVPYDVASGGESFLIYHSMTLQDEFKSVLERTWSSCAFEYGNWL